MLVHVTRFNAVQAQVAEQLEDELATIVSRLRRGDGNHPKPLRGELENIWLNDFVVTSEALRKRGGRALAWGEVSGHLVAAAEKIEIRRINGTVRDSLEYIEHAEGLSVIAIGGEKLSRGLTLEGLSVSYYLRASRMYDTLMQMGRWFGYRPGYLDLCRLYTSEELIEWYRDIAAAHEELLMEFDHMAALGRTPGDFGLRVKEHPSGLMVTAAAKMRHGRHVQVSFSGTVEETVIFDETTGVVTQNVGAGADLIRKIDGTAQRSTMLGNYLWSDVDGSEIVEFLGSYVTHENAKKADAGVLRRYVESRFLDDELVAWTVALISSTTGAAASI
jgi:hypothetical protein